MKTEQIFMITIKLPIQNKIDIQDLQRIYSSCLRYSYNRFNNGLNEKEIKKLTKDKFRIGSWFVQCCIKEAQELSKRFKDKTIVFGGKNNWVQYLRKKITKEEFKENRLNPVCSQGDTFNYGNRMFCLDIIDNNIIIFKPNRKTRIQIQLPKLRKNLKKQLYRLEELSKERKLPYTVRLDKNYIYISFDESIVNSEFKIKYLKDNRVLGIDLNPNYIGYSILEFKNENEFKVIHKEVISLNKLTIKSNKSSDSIKSKYLNNKRHFELLEVIKHIVNKSRNFKCRKISIEGLNIESSDTKQGKRFNRLCNNVWNRNLIVSNLKKHCNIYGIELVEVNPVYSSFVGNIQYGNDLDCPDMIASSIEIARRGQFKYRKDWFYPIRKNVENLRNLWKEDLDWSSFSWKELFSLAKESKLKYRFSLNESLEFLRFKSYKSNIGLYNLNYFMSSAFGPENFLLVMFIHLNNQDNLPYQKRWETRSLLNEHSPNRS